MPIVDVVYRHCGHIGSVTYYANETTQNGCVILPTTMSQSKSSSSIISLATYTGRPNIVQSLCIECPHGGPETVRKSECHSMMTLNFKFSNQLRAYVTLRRHSLLITIGELATQSSQRSLRSSSL